MLAIYYDRFTKSTNVFTVNRTEYLTVRKEFHLIGFEDCRLILDIDVEEANVIVSELFDTGKISLTSKNVYLRKGKY